MDTTPFLRALLASRTRGLPTRVGLRAALGTHATPVEVALLGGRSADRLGFAFAVGYDAALHALVPGLDPHGPALLCATEAGGAHPRAIETRLATDGEGLRVWGTKTWATRVGEAPTLLVLASAGSEGDRRDLRLVRLDPDAPGVAFTELPTLPMVPEIPHLEVTFSGAPVAEVLPGDGWADWVRPFRTVEDVHVGAAAVGYLLGVGIDAGWSAEVRSRLVALALAFRALDGAEWSAPETHVAVAGGLAALDAVVAAVGPEWGLVAADEAARWERDRPLLGVAGRARAARLAAALGALGWSAPVSR